MKEQDQQTMDGSPARVQRTLMDLAATGKFAEYDSRHDPSHNPVYIDIKFQAGPIREVGVNGCSIEDVIDVLVVRLAGFQRGPFKCEENEAALFSLREAKARLMLRTARRSDQGVEGTNAPHQSG